MRACVLDPESHLLDVIQSELEVLTASSPELIPTSILVFPEDFEAFEDYLDALDFVERIIDALKLVDEIQVASFHPSYVFEGAPADDPANWTNRSPHPMFHFLRTADVAQAIDGHHDTDAIPERNEAYFRALGRDQVRTLLEQCYLSN